MASDHVDLINLFTHSFGSEDDRVGSINHTSPRSLLDQCLTGGRSPAMKSVHNLKFKEMVLDLLK